MEIVFHGRRTSCSHGKYRRSAVLCGELLRQAYLRGRLLLERRTKHECSRLVQRRDWKVSQASRIRGQALRQLHGDGGYRRRIRVDFPARALDETLGPRPALIQFIWSHVPNLVLQNRRGAIDTNKQIMYSKRKENWWGKESIGGVPGGNFAVQERKVDNAVCALDHGRDGHDFLAGHSCYLGQASP